MTSKLRVRLGQHEFAVPTTLSTAEIVHAASRAEAASASVAEGLVRRAASRADGIAYQVVGTGGRFQLTFALTWTEAERGTRRVRLAVGDYLTTRQRRLLLPVGPRVAPGLAPFARFSEWMQHELHTRGRVTAG